MLKYTGTHEVVYRDDGNNEPVRVSFSNIYVLINIYILYKIKNTIF